MSVAIGRVVGPTTPLLCVCSNRPRGWTDHVVTRVPLHDLASRGPSASNRTDRRTNTGLSHNIYRASIASRDKKMVYLFVGHLRVNLKVLPSNFFYVVWNSVSCDGPLPNAKRHLPRSPESYFNIPEWRIPGMADSRNGGSPEWRTPEWRTQTKNLSLIRAYDTVLQFAMFMRVFVFFKDYIIL